REANQNSIQHNKFIVFLRGQQQKPQAVWTGSTNISEGGIFGQTNVGHWVRDPATAERFRQYWELLSQDPGSQPNEERTAKIASNEAFKRQLEALQEDIEPDTLDHIPVGVTPIFSPRTSLVMLSTYAALLDSAQSYGAISLAFGINDVFKQA